MWPVETVNAYGNMSSPKNSLVRFDGDGLVGVGHHGDQHIEQDDDVAGDVTAKHEQGPEPGEVLDASQLKI